MGGYETGKTVLQVIQWAGWATLLIGAVGAVALSGTLSGVALVTLLIQSVLGGLVLVALGMVGAAVLKMNENLGRLSQNVYEIAKIVEEAAGRA